MKERYKSMGSYTKKSSKDTLEITSFAPDGSETIYEFLEDFEKKYKSRGSEAQRADLLWTQHLS